LHFSGKVQKRPLALLKVLIAFGGRRVNEHQICDALWPESDGDAAHSAFTSTLSRLRKLLKVEGAIESRGGLISLNERIFWVDFWSLEQLLEQALEVWEKGSAQRAAMLTQKACSASQGPFLPDDPDLPWAEPIRERIKTKMLKSVKALGSYFESMGQWEKALSCYAEGLKSDPCAEVLYERRMICFQQLGQTIEALKEYQQCCTALSTVLDVQPSESTQTLFQSLKRNHPPQT
jgi:LuxR family transcriptional regulator, maltose regulon positive regulatory protein